MELIVTTREDLKTILKECFNDFQPAQAPAPAPEFLYSIKDLADFLHCSPVTAQRIKNSGKIRYKQFGRKVVFDPSEVLEDLNRKR
jgi:hypothetical protein